MHRFMDPANAITLLGLTAAVTCSLLAGRGLLAWALATLLVCGLCDLFDGLVARRLTRSEEQRRFGARLDSLVDACAFGMAPVLVLHAAGLQSPPELALLALFAACAVWRLAYFDTVGLAVDGDARYFTGLPTTFSALALPLAGLASFWSPGALRVAAAATAFVLAALMVSPLRIRKPGGVWYGILGAVALGLIALYALVGAGLVVTAS